MDIFSAYNAFKLGDDYKDKPIIILISLKAYRWYLNLSGTYGIATFTCICKEKEYVRMKKYELKQITS